MCSSAGIPSLFQAAYRRMEWSSGVTTLSSSAWTRKRSGASGGSRHIVRRAGIDGSGKIGSAIRIVVKRHGCGDVAASGETKNPDAVAGDAPLWGVRADEAYRLLSVGDRERDDGLPTLRHLGGIACVAVAGTHDAVLENERGHADGIQPAREIRPFMTDPEFAKTAAGTNDHRRAGAQRGVGEIRRKRRMRHVGDGVRCVLRHAFFVVPALRARRSAGPEGNHLWFRCKYRDRQQNEQEQFSSHEGRSLTRAALPEECTAIRVEGKFPLNALSRHVDCCGYPVTREQAGSSNARTCISILPEGPHLEQQAIPHAAIPNCTNHFSVVNTLGKSVFDSACSIEGFQLFGGEFQIQTGEIVLELRYLPRSHDRDYWHRLMAQPS